MEVYLDCNEVKRIDTKEEDRIGGEKDEVEVRRDREMRCEWNEKDCGRGRERGYEKEEVGPGEKDGFPGEGRGEGGRGNTTPQYLQYVFFSDIRVLI